jgi:hypothetical protein
MLDQEAREHGKHTRDLEWFRPPEHKTLRPMCVVLLVSLSVSGTLESLCVRGTSVKLYSSMRTLPFTGSRGARTLSGVPTGGPGDILNNVHIGALNASDPEIYLISLRAYPPSGYGLVPSC